MVAAVARRTPRRCSRPLFDLRQSHTAGFTGCQEFHQAPSLTQQMLNSQEVLGVVAAMLLKLIAGESAKARASILWFRADRAQASAIQAKHLAL